MHENYGCKNPYNVPDKIDNRQKTAWFKNA